MLYNKYEFKLMYQLKFRLNMTTSKKDAYIGISQLIFLIRRPH